jgi:hypothetical protein
MRLDAVRIGTFKNLRDFSVDFDEESPYTVLIYTISLLYIRIGLVRMGSGTGHLISQPCSATLTVA